MLGGWLVCWPALSTVARAFTLASAAASSERKHESVSARKEYAAKAGGQPERLPYFQSWLPSES